MTVESTKRGRGVDRRIVESYGEKYCLSLEAAYGEGMMSDGGDEAVERMFEGMDIRGQRVIDVGAGLGGMAFHLAHAYGARVTGCEINPWLVAEATRRTPDRLRGLVDFVEMEQGDSLPFATGSIDVVASKGALVHVEDKIALLQDMRRVLGPGGRLVLNDWLSSTRGEWSRRIAEMARMEGLILFAETQQSYLERLATAGFRVTAVREESRVYALDNHAIADRFERLSAEERRALSERFGESYVSEAITGYRWIAEAMEANELLVTTFHAAPA